MADQFLTPDQAGYDPAALKQMLARMTPEQLRAMMEPYGQEMALAERSGQGMTQHHSGLGGALGALANVVNSVNERNIMAREHQDASGRLGAYRDSGSGIGPEDRAAMAAAIRGGGGSPFGVGDLQDPTAGMQMPGLQGTPDALAGLGGVPSLAGQSSAPVDINAFLYGRKPAQVGQFSPLAPGDYEG